MAQLRLGQGFSVISSGCLVIKNCDFQFAICKKKCDMFEILAVLGNAIKKIR